MTNRLCDPINVTAIWYTATQLKILIIEILSGENIEKRVKEVFVKPYYAHIKSVRNTGVQTQCSSNMQEKFPKGGIHSVPGGLWLKYLQV